MNSNFLVIHHDCFIIGLRSVCEADEEFLYEVYANTRIEEIRSWGWESHEAEQFLWFQFNARLQGYRFAYPTAESLIISADEQPIGHFMIQYLEREILGIDIALLEPWRNRGIGSAILRACFDQAKEASLPFRIHVEKQNVRARQLYEKHGFRWIGENDVYDEMEWRSE